MAGSRNRFGQIWYQPSTCSVPQLEVFAVFAALLHRLRFGAMACQRVPRRTVVSLFRGVLEVATLPVSFRIEFVMSKPCSSAHLDPPPVLDLRVQLHFSEPGFGGVEAGDQRPGHRGRRCPSVRLCMLERISGFVCCFALLVCGRAVRRWWPSTG